MEQLSTLLGEYNQILSTQEFVGEDLDYAILQGHIPFLEQLAQIGKSSISVYDLFKREHVYKSPTFHLMLGYDIESVEGDLFFDQKIHPEDFVALVRNGIELMRFCFDLPAEERMEYKLVNEYRMKNGAGEYVRVIEQHQALELDKNGNLWLALSLVDISPDRDVSAGIKSRLINFKTGEIFHFPVEERGDNGGVPKLSSREQEVLSLIRDGLISKEIADRLYISVHTVNTHRQRILEKLDVNNSHEAIAYASRLGFLE
ncbi:MAG: LuxR C-terminal-related transcriptional regulator [Candidatus Kapaibacterium sp.]